MPGFYKPQFLREKFLRSGGVSVNERKKHLLLFTKRREMYFGRPVLKFNSSQDNWSVVKDPQNRRALGSFRFMLVRKNGNLFAPSFEQPYGLLSQSKYRFLELVRR